MNDLEKSYLDKYKKIINDTIPNFIDANDQLAFYEIIKQEGLTKADVFIKSTTTLLNDIKNKFGEYSEIYKEISDDLVLITTDFIYMEINWNIYGVNYSTINNLQKSKMSNQNQSALLLLKELEKYYAEGKNKSDFQKIKSTIADIEYKLDN